MFFPGKVAYDRVLVVKAPWGEFEGGYTPPGAGVTQEGLVKVA